MLSWYICKYLDKKECFKYQRLTINIKKDQKKPDDPAKEIVWLHFFWVGGGNLFLTCDRGQTRYNHKHQPRIEI